MMDMDFALILVVLVGLCGAVWLLDSLLLKKTREKAIDEYCRKHGKPINNEESNEELSALAQEPIIVEYAKSFFPVLLIVLALRSFVLEPFQIPTGSMIPTMKVGDFILVNKYTYGLRLPVIGTKLMDIGEPQRGDVMVFIPPHEDMYFVKRVIGLPGDRIRYENKLLYINGEEIRREYVESIEVDYGQGVLPGTLHKELLGGVEHETQFIDIVDNLGQRTSWIVPDEHYFMMGDNRDNSSDSRVWGTVHEGNIVGKAIAVWLHKDPGLNLPNFSNNQLIK
jgi:signal peptidase I